MKSFLISLSLLMLISCSTGNNESSSNLPPSDFEVQILSTTYSNVLLNWSQSFDPEEEEVNYVIYLEGSEIVKNIKERTYMFQSLDPATNYTGRIVAYDTSGNERIKEFSFRTDENAAPSSFEIVSIAANNVSAGVSWTKSSDPENEEVVYNLYLNGNLVKESHDFEFFRFEGLSANMSYNAQIIAQDTEGNETVLDFIIETADGIYKGDLSFRTQKGIEDFGAQGYVEITGDLEMSGFAGTSSISDLSPLETLKTVKGYFDINFCNELKTLSGLKIEHIGKSFRIKQNYYLEDLKGLEKLNEILGDFDVNQNSRLETMHSLINIKTIGFSLLLRNNGALKSVIGFNNLSKVENIFIDNNYVLEKVSGFNEITEMERDFVITDNPAIHTITGFQKFRRVGRLRFYDTLVTHIDMFSKLEIVSGVLAIINNKELTNIKGLKSLTEMTYGDLDIGGNIKINSLDGLQNLNSIGGTIHIGGNNQLSDFCALQNAMQGFDPSFRPSIINNAYNPTPTQIANGNCK